MVHWLPDGSRQLIPHLIVKGGKQAIEYYKKAFGAEEHGCCMPMPDGRIGHAEMKIGDAVFMLADDCPEWSGGKERHPLALGGSSVQLMIYVPDCDATLARAAAAGGKVTMPAQDMFWGDRYGQVQDPFGHTWAIATHKQDLTEEQILAAAKKAGF
jgi:uncharacterized glyoxalase superfamily protein PhnB